jgi:hypothetical protein
MREFGAFGVLGRLLLRSRAIAVALVPRLRRSAVSANPLAVSVKADADDGMRRSADFLFEQSLKGPDRDYGR